jgi:hypothetical protein
MITEIYKSSNGYMHDSDMLMGASIVKWITFEHNKGFSESDLELCISIEFLNRITNI